MTLLSFDLMVLSSIIAAWADIQAADTNIGYHRAEHHQAEREQRHVRHAPAEPQHLAVRDHDDGQVLEDGVHRHRQELERLGPRVDDPL